MSELKKLREIYDLQLGVGPFPNEECQIAGIGGALHGNLIIYLADIAGIAERGEALQEVEDSTAQSFRKIVEKGFWERYPECKNRITATATPKLFKRISATEEASRLIKNALSLPRLSA